MRRIAFLADIHIDNYKAHGGAMRSGVNDRCRLTLDVLHAACSTAKVKGAGHVVVCGDLFNDVRPIPQVISAVQTILCSSGLQFTLLVGNHEQVSSGLGDHALGPLAMAGIRVVEQPKMVRPFDGVEVFAVPFSSSDSGAAVISEALLGMGARKAARELASSTRRLLAFHYGIVDGDTAGFLRDSKDAVALVWLRRMLAECGFTAAFAGHWHTWKDWFEDDELPVTQLGALCPRGWSDPGLEGYGTLAIYDADDDSVTFHEIPGPRFVQTRGRAKILRGNATRLFVRCVCASDDDQPLPDTVPEWASVEILPDMDETIVATRSAAVAARSSSSLEDALAAFVEQMPVEDGVDRAAVRSMSLAFLAGREP